MTRDIEISHGGRYPYRFKDLLGYIFTFPKRPGLSYHSVVHISDEPRIPALLEDAIKLSQRRASLVDYCDRFYQSQWWFDLDLCNGFSVCPLIRHWVRLYSNEFRHKAWDGIYVGGRNGIWEGIRTIIIFAMILWLCVTHTARDGNRSSNQEMNSKPINC